MSFKYKMSTAYYPSSTIPVEYVVLELIYLHWDSEWVDWVLGMVR